MPQFHWPVWRSAPARACRNASSQATQGYLKATLWLGTRSLEHDFNASILCPATRRVIRRYRMRFAESFGRQDLGVDAMRAEIRDNVCSSPGRQIDVVGDARALQCRPDRQIIGEPVDDDFGVLK